MSRALRLALAVFAVAAAGVAAVEAIERLGKPAPPAAARTTEAVAETEPVPSGGDAADDAAIWVNRRRPGRSVVIGTDKKAGIAVYALDGREIQYRADGEINNVDLRRGVPLGGGRRGTVVAATDRTAQTVGLYRVRPRSRTLAVIDPSVADPRLAVNGVCMYREPTAQRRFGFFVTGLRGEVEQWRLVARRGRALGARRVRGFRFEGSAEACVADDRRGAAFFAEERTGIWKASLARPGASRALIARTTDDGALVADVEGLAIAHRRRRPDVLVASSQGNDSYAAYRAGSGAYLYSLVVADGEIDGAEDTDGLDVSTARLGPRFPHGLLVVQDGSNEDGNQNFKLVPLCRGGALGCER